MDDLARRLKIPVRFGRTWANGCLERLWHYAARQYPRGNVGAAPDWALADACGWPKSDAAALVQALIESKWLDISAEHRLIIHDWHEHADESVKKTLKNRGLLFCFPENSATEPEKFLQPQPLPLPLPKPQPVTEPRRPTPIRTIPPRTESSIRLISDSWPDPQDLPLGIDMAIAEVSTSGNPESTLRAMEENLPLWASAMLDGRAKVKQLRWVIKDAEYLRKPREPTKKAEPTFNPAHQVYRDPFKELKPE